MPNLVGASCTWNRRFCEVGSRSGIRRRKGLRLSGSVGWSFLAFAAVAIAFLAVPEENEYPGALAGSFVFLLVQWFLPACRPVPGKLLCPWNWALFVFFLQLVVLPLSLLLFGPALGVLPLLPSDRAINFAMLMNSAAFLAFCGTYHYFAGSSRTSRKTNRWREERRAQAKPLSLMYIGLNGAVGIVGFFLAFGALNKVAEYFSDPSGYLMRLVNVSDKLGPAVGQLLRPFFGICVVMMWCRWLDGKRLGKSKQAGSVVTILAAVAVCLSNATFNYNRGSVVVPLVAMLTVVVSGPCRVPRRMAFSAGAILLIVLLLVPFYGAYRTSNFTGQELFQDASVRGLLAQNVKLPEIIQVYGGAPQFLAFFLEMGHWGANPRWGNVLISSALAPLPILGKAFREGSGTAIYNRLIYGQVEAQDQIAPFQGETFLDFHMAGVLVAFCVLGWVAFRLQTAFVNATSFFDVFTWQYFSIWMFFLIFGSVSVVSQILIYFCWPFYLYFIHRSIHSRPGQIPSTSSLATIISKTA